MPVILHCCCFLPPFIQALDISHYYWGLDLRLPDRGCLDDGSENGRPVRNGFRNDRESNITSEKEDQWKENK